MKNWVKSNHLFVSIPKVYKEFLISSIEDDLSEKKSTGISKILRELKRNGSPLPEFETNADRTYMITKIKIHEKFSLKRL